MNLVAVAALQKRLKEARELLAAAHKSVEPGFRITGGAIIRSRGEVRMEQTIAAVDKLADIVGYLIEEK
jgi:hypothetical protein